MFLKISSWIFVVIAAGLLLFLLAGYDFQSEQPVIRFLRFEADPAHPEERHFQVAVFEFDNRSSRSAWMFASEPGLGPVSKPFLNYKLASVADAQREDVSPAWCCGPSPKLDEVLPGQKEVFRVGLHPLSSASAMQAGMEFKLENQRFLTELNGYLGSYGASLEGRRWKTIWSEQVDLSERLRERL